MQAALRERAPLLPNGLPSLLSHAQRLSTCRLDNFTTFEFDELIGDVTRASDGPTGTGHVINIVKLSLTLGFIIDGHVDVHFSIAFERAAVFSGSELELVNDFSRTVRFGLDLFDTLLALGIGDDFKNVGTVF